MVVVVVAAAAVVAVAMVAAPISGRGWTTFTPRPSTSGAVAQSRSTRGGGAARKWRRPVGILRKVSGLVFCDFGIRTKGWGSRVWALGRSLPLNPRPHQC